MTVVLVLFIPVLVCIYIVTLLGQLAIAVVIVGIFVLSVLLALAVFLSLWLVLLVVGVALYYCHY